MPLIIAIEPDRRQAARISTLARERLSVELLVVDSAGRALAALSERTPDLILTPQLLSPKDEAALDERLRQLDAAGSKVQTLMIPVLASTGRRGDKKDGLLKRLRRTKDEPAVAGGCDPAVFAAQIAEYLEKAADERANHAAFADEERAPGFIRTEPVRPSIVEPPAASVVAEAKRPEPTPSIIQDYAFSSEPEPVAAASESESIFRAPVYQAPEYVAPAAIAFVEESPALESFQEESPALESFQAEAATLHDFSAQGENLDPYVSVVRQPEPDHEPSVSFLKAVEPELEFEPVRHESIAARESLAEPVPAAFEEFISFDQISLSEAPTLGLDELRAFTEDADATGDSVSVLDALEILDEPEIPLPAAFQASERAEPKRRKAHAPAPIPAPMLLEESEPEPTPSDLDFDKDLWMPLPVAAQRRWPSLEGPVVKATATPAFDAPPDPGVEFAPPPAEDRSNGRKRKSSKPHQDEWGFFDPVQCGFAALLAKLDEVTDKEDA